MLPTLILLCAALAHATPQYPRRQLPGSTTTNTVLSTSVTSITTSAAQTSAIANNAAIQLLNNGPIASSQITDDANKAAVAPATGPSTVNTARVLYCLDDASTNYKVGLQITFHDAVSNLDESVQFYTSGVPGVAIYQFLRKHTNAHGFWVDNDILPPNVGLNAGFDPSGKSMNFAQRFSVARGREEVQNECRKAFRFDGGRADRSFWEVYEDGAGGPENPRVPALLTKG